VGIVALLPGKEFPGLLRPGAQVSSETSNEEEPWDETQSAPSLHERPVITSAMETRDSASAELKVTFSLTEGGPGGTFMRRPWPRNVSPGASSMYSASILTALAWLPLCLLSLFEHLALRGVKLPFLYDIAAHTRFLLAVPLLVLADIPIDARVRQAVGHFLAANLVDGKELSRFSAIVFDTLRIRDARIGGIAVIVLAYVASYYAVLSFSSHSGGTWVKPEHMSGMTVAGYWYALVSLPILQFLMFRWLYRMAVWSSFLWRVCALDMRLVPTHPDGAGGLGFLGKLLIPYGLVVFALSAVVSSAIADQILFGGGRLQDYELSYAALFVVMVMVFAGPMLTFVPRLCALKQRGLLEYGSLGSRYAQAFHRKWLEQAQAGTEQLLGSSDIQSLADLGNSFEIIRRMRIFPAESRDFLAMVLPGLIPALPLTAAVMPVGDIVKGLLRLVA
jgi:hypothetical protein